MRKILQKIFENKTSKYALYIVFYAVILPIHLIGKLIYLSTKPVRFIGFLLMFNIHSAIEEITDWRISLNLKDVL